MRRRRAVEVVGGVLDEQRLFRYMMYGLRRRWP
jgi:hypothetical protein